MCQHILNDDYLRLIFEKIISHKWKVRGAGDHMGLGPHF